MLPASLAPMRHRAFRAVWFGSFVSNVGTWMQAAALGYYVANLTHSAAWSAINSVLVVSGSRQRSSGNRSSSIRIPAASILCV